MRSLRGQIVLLVLVAVVGTLIVIGLRAPRLARREFEASITSLDRKATATLPVDELSRDFEAGGWDAVRRRLAAPAADGDPGLVVIDPDGRIVAAHDSALLDRTLVPAPDSGWILESRTARVVTRLVLRGGGAIRSPAGDTVGHVFVVPADDVAGIDAGDAFSGAFDRSLWLLIALVLVGATAVAVVLSGRVVEPLERLAVAARRIGAGDLTTRVGPVRTRELAQVAVAFDTMADVLERSEADRRRMIRDVAHELRTPLTNLRGQLEAMQDGLRDPDDAGIGSLLEETMLLERLVGDLGQLAEADAGRLDVRIEAVAVDVEARRAIEAFSQDERAPAGRITADVAPGLVVHAPGSEVRIEAARHGADRVEVAVIDGGPGIPPEHLGRVFDRLYRADPSRTRATGGAGLGLAIVRDLVEAQGGEVGIGAAGPDGGTRVWFRLPSPP